jgi:hypothetical protein
MSAWKSTLATDHHGTHHVGMGGGMTVAKHAVDLVTRPIM